MSRSSSRLQQLEQDMLALTAHCQVLRGPRTGRLQGFVKGLSIEGSFYHYPPGAVLSQHYGQLQHLLEQRAQLLFLQEYAQCTRVAMLYIKKLSSLLEQELGLMTDGSRSPERPNPAWCFGMGAVCQEILIHFNHWDDLCAKARSDVWLRTVLFQRTETLAVMRQTLRVLGLQALVLIERCICTALSALASAQLDKVPGYALEDLLAAAEIFNQVVEEQRVPRGGSQWRNQTPLLWDCCGLTRRQPRSRCGLPAPFPVLELMRILAEQRGQIAADQLYQWASRQSLLQALHTGAKAPTWEQLEQLFPMFPAVHLSEHSTNGLAPENSPQAINDEPVIGQACPWASDFPLTAFIHQDNRSVEVIFQALVASTDLLAPHIPSRPMEERSQPSEGCPRGCEKEATDQTRLQVKRPKSVQWRDLGQYGACVEFHGRYRTMLWAEFGKALIHRFLHPAKRSTLGSINQWSDQMVFQLVTWLNHSCRAEMFPQECRGVVDAFALHLLSNTAFRHWDQVLCVSLGSGLKDKCFPAVDEENGMVLTCTAQQLLQLFPPLLTVLRCLDTSAHLAQGDCDAHTMTSLSLRAHCRAVASVHASTFWVMSKAYQFLSSWSLNKFLLITLGDLKVLRTSAERLLQRVEALGVNGNHFVLCKQQDVQLTQGVTALQVFSERVLRIFSMDCKRMSEEIFEQTMPSAKHWRVNFKTEFPSSPSEYAATAAQSVIGQVLEGVQLLPKEAWIPALTEAMTAFMEAWMEHILKQKIKFSIQGALQLKQDFDLIRDLIRSEEYSLSEEIHQRLLSLRVFHQVDSAIVCLLQQPVAKPYMPSRAWEPFRRCCPSRANVVDQSSSSLNNFESMDLQSAYQQALAQAEGSTTPDILASTPQESYLAMAQQEWLDLRIHNSNRWKLPGLPCLTRSEP
ncbi:hypothetical protein UPYG_G00213350 [Umbra pygmaea]|uniref:Coiled-coil protein 142 C-terminal domain-containing protein n=1 Tax=Umbra pygmaea TaxID=75934 RepID=A0ABD0X4D6_UMBPY